MALWDCSVGICRRPTKQSLERIQSCMGVIVYLVLIIESQEVNSRGNAGPKARRTDMPQKAKISDELGVEDMCLDRP